jgi:predicted DNA binding CopG/RHH family protein
MHAGVSRSILTPMQNSSQAAPSPGSRSFAGLLAALASPAKSDSGGTRAWSDSDLEDDVVTLSYERALRARVRSKPAERGDRPVSAAEGTEAQPVIAAKPETNVRLDQQADVELTAAARAAAELERRAASVTIRLSHTECARLRQRAAEAGLTVSAYLRSCVLEADTLRTQVKQALAEMRTANGTGTKETGGQGNKGTRPIRVLAHIGSLCIGLSATRSS